MLSDRKIPSEHAELVYGRLGIASKGLGHGSREMRRGKVAACGTATAALQASSTGIIILLFSLLIITYLTLPSQ
jgi:hypothetical protein